MSEKTESAFADVCVAAVAKYHEVLDGLGPHAYALAAYQRMAVLSAVELAYRAGREEAARELEAEADDEAQRPGRAEPSELIERWLREGARIAREGSSLKRSSEGEDQDTPEGRDAEDR